MMYVSPFSSFFLQEQENPQIHNFKEMGSKLLLLNSSGFCSKFQLLNSYALSWFYFPFIAHLFPTHVHSENPQLWMQA